MIRTAADYRDAADKLRLLDRKKDIKAFEKSSGLKTMLHGLMFDDVAGDFLPITDFASIPCTCIITKESSPGNSECCGLD